MAGKRLPAMLDSPRLDPKLSLGGGSNLLDDGDESGFLNLNSKDIDKMNLVDTPPVSRVEKKAAAYFSSPSKAKKRPSWGPKSSPAKGNMRLLEGVEDAGPSRQPAEIRRKERTLGGLGQDRIGTAKARQSIFAKPAYLSNGQREGKSQSDANEKEEEGGEDSFYKDPVLSSSTGSVQSRIAAIEANRLQVDARQSSSGNTSESKEQLDNQLKELKKMNGVFEAYERMLSGSAHQVENFAQRIAETNSLLDIYIDLMRQADRTQQLLLDADWKGATDDESAHALAMELAERERQRKIEEAEQAARLVEQRRQEAEQARREALQAEQRKTSSSIRGGRGASTSSRGSAIPSVRGRGGGAAPPVSSRVPSATRGRTVSATSSSARGAPTSTRGTTASTSTGGLNNRYASVRSSGYGPPK